MQFDGLTISECAISRSSLVRFDPAAARTAMIESPARPFRKQRLIRLSVFRWPRFHACLKLQSFESTPFNFLQSTTSSLGEPGRYPLLKSPFQRRRFILIYEAGIRSCLKTVECFSHVPMPAIGLLVCREAPYACFTSPVVAFAPLKSCR